MQGLLNILNHLIDDVVVADFHTHPFRDPLYAQGIAHGKADDDGVGGAGQQHIGFGNIAAAGVENPHPGLGVGQPFQGLAHRLDAALHIGFQHQVKLFNIPGVNLLDHFLQGQGAGLGLLGGFEPFPVGSRGTGQALGGKDRHQIPGFGQGTEPQHFGRRARLHFLDHPAAVVGQGFDPAPSRAGYDIVPHGEGAALHQHGGRGAAFAIQLGLDDDAVGRAGRIGLEFGDFRHYQQVCQQVVDAVAGAGGNRNGNDVAAPILDQQIALAELPLDPFRIGSGQIHFVDGNYNRNLGGLGVVDGFLGLRHNAVIGGHYQDGNIRNPRAAGADGGKGFVAGGVQKGDFVALIVHLVSADVLGNAADFPVGDMGVADGVQQAGLAVIDMAQDGHYRRAGAEIGGGFRPAAADQRALFRYRLGDPGADAIGGRNQGGHFVVDNLVHGHHNPVSHQLLDDIHRALVNQFRQVLDRQGLRQHQGAGRAAAAAFSGSGHSTAPIGWGRRPVPGSSPAGVAVPGRGWRF